MRLVTWQRWGESARPLEGPFTWDDLVVPERVREALKDFALAARERAAFWKSGRPRRLLPRGKGLAALFSGPPGTGKTMAAQVLAADLQQNLYRVDLAAVVTKYIGETEKNLKRLLAAAESCDAILLFDEADALFGKRSEVRDSHDRYANSDTNYLLQLLEEYRGVVIVTSNQTQNIDPNFVRRMRFVVEFPMPDANERLSIWRKVIQALCGNEELGRLKEVIDALAQNVELSGAQIKHAVLASISLARRSHEAVELKHLLRSVTRELSKARRKIGATERERLTGGAASPGVFIEEVPSGTRTIFGVATSIAAFVGRALRGKIDYPVRIRSFAEFERKFGGLWVESTMSYAVQHFFLNGGTDALIVRVVNGAETAAFRLLSESAGDVLVMEASSPGDWANNLRLTVDHDTRNISDTTRFNLMVEELDPETGMAIVTETHSDLTTVAAEPRYISKVLREESQLVRVSDPHPSPTPNVRPASIAQASPSAAARDGSDITAAEVLGSKSGKTGIYALLKADLFNLLCIPPLTRDTDIHDTLNLDLVLEFCKDRRAMFIMDTPSSWSDTSTATAGMAGLRFSNRSFGAIYFPHIKVKDPLSANRLESFVPCGAVAGVFARTDAQRGVWKAPVGLEARLAGVDELTVKLSDDENGRLNPLGLNCLRAFPDIGNVMWGARTLDGADQLASEWKYVPVRRLALFIEESLYRGTQWVVFEPNDELLWEKVRLTIGAFLHILFRQGAFAGATPRESWFVKCDKETTTERRHQPGDCEHPGGFRTAEAGRVRSHTDTADGRTTPLIAVANSHTTTSRL